MTELITPPCAVTLTLRVAEAHVEDPGHAVAQLEPAGLKGIDAQAGDVLKITGGAIGVARTDIESLYESATLSAIAEFHRGTHVAPFVVQRSDFQSVLESDRGNPKPLRGANELSNSAGNRALAYLNDNESRI